MPASSFDSPRIGEHAPQSPRPLPPWAPRWRVAVADAAGLGALAAVSVLVAARALDSADESRRLVAFAAALITAFALCLAASRIAETAAARRVLRTGTLVPARIVHTERVSVWRAGRPSVTDGGALDVAYALELDGAAAEERLEAERLAALGRLPRAGDRILVARSTGRRPASRIWSFAESNQEGVP